MENGTLPDYPLGIIKPRSSRRSPRPRVRVEMVAAEPEARPGEPEAFPEVMDRFQTARYLGIGISLLDLLTAADEVPHWRLGRLLRFSKRALDERMGASVPVIVTAHSLPR